MIETQKPKQKNTTQDLGSYFVLFAIYLAITTTILITLVAIFPTFEPVFFWIAFFSNIALGILFTFLFSLIKTELYGNPWVYTMDKILYYFRRGVEKSLNLSIPPKHNNTETKIFDKQFHSFTYDDATIGSVVCFKISIRDVLEQEMYANLNTVIQNNNDFRVLIVNRGVPNTNNKATEYVKLKYGDLYKKQIKDMIKNDDLSNALDLTELDQYFKTYNNEDFIDLRQILWYKQKFYPNPKNKSKFLTPYDALNENEKIVFDQMSELEKADPIVKFHSQVLQDFTQHETYIFFLDNTQFKKLDNYESFVKTIESIPNISWSLVPNYTAKSIFYESVLGLKPGEEFNNIVYHKSYSKITVYNNGVEKAYYLQPIKIGGFENVPSENWIKRLLNVAVDGEIAWNLTFFNKLTKKNKYRVLDEYNLKQEDGKTKKDQLESEDKQKLRQRLLDNTRYDFKTGNIIFIKADSLNKLQQYNLAIQQRLTSLSLNYYFFDYQQERTINYLLKGEFLSLSNSLADPKEISTSHPFLISGGYRDNTGLFIGYTSENNHPVQYDIFNFANNSAQDRAIYSEIDKNTGAQPLYEAPHMIVVGSTGSGKSSLLKRILFESIPRRRKNIILDMQGELVNTVKSRMIMGARGIKLISFDPNDPTFFNPLAPVAPTLDNTGELNKIIENAKLKNSKRPFSVLSNNEKARLVEVIWADVHKSYWDILNVFIQDTSGFTTTIEEKNKFYNFIENTIRKIYNESAVEDFINKGIWFNFSTLTNKIYEYTRVEQDLNNNLVNILKKLKNPDHPEVQFFNGSEQLDLDNYHTLVFSIPELTILSNSNNKSDQQVATITWITIMRTIQTLLYSGKYYTEGYNIVLEEFHKLTTNNSSVLKSIQPLINSTISMLFKEGRKYNAMVMIATQDLQDLKIGEKGDKSFDGLRTNTRFNFINQRSKTALQNFFGVSEGDSANPLNNHIQNAIEASRKKYHFMVSNGETPQNTELIKVFHPPQTEPYANIPGKAFFQREDNIASLEQINKCLNPRGYTPNSLENDLVYANAFILKQLAPQIYQRLDYVVDYEDYFREVKQSEV